MLKAFSRDHGNTQNEALKAATLLIIDDDEVLLPALSSSLKWRLPETEIDTADTPEQALMLVYSKDYDAVISDIRMPRMDGVTLLAKLQAIQPMTPVLLMTGHLDDELRARAHAGGAYAFLNKPLDPDFIAALLRQAILERRVELANRPGG